jgi:hypothetical protein
MSDQPDNPPDEPDETAEERARRRARVFGEVLPEATDRRDDSDPAEEQRDRGDDWLRANVPPHHG